MILMFDKMWGLYIGVGLCVWVYVFVCGDCACRFVCVCAYVWNERKKRQDIKEENLQLLTRNKDEIKMTLRLE